MCSKISGIYESRKARIIVAKLEGKCPFCEKKIDMADFKDELSRREYQISGLCQACQDKVFEE